MRPPFARTLHDLLEEQAATRPAAIAVIANGESLTFASLAQRAARLAAGLRTRGLRHGERIGLLLNNRVEFLVALFGASAAGATIVPFSTWSTRQELDFLLSDSGIRTLFALPDFGKEDFRAHLDALKPRHPMLRDLVMVDAPAPEGWLGYDTLLDTPLTPLPPGEAASAGDDAIVLYTSGSTSKPKAVRLAQHAIIENGFNIGERQGLTPEDRVLAAIPLFWAYGAVNALPASFTHGAALVLQSRFEPGEAIDLIERHRCTAIYTLPAMTAALIRHPAFNRDRTRSLRKGLTIGAPQDVVAAATVLGATQISNIYGASETYGNCCVTPHDWPLEQRSACQGPPLPGVSLRIIDQASGAELGRDQPGLIEVKGYLMRGYGGASAEHNAAVFTRDGWFRTGDIGQLDAEGRLQFLGRSGEMIKRSGINVSPAEVEDALMQHPGVAQAAVVGVPDAEKGELIVAFVVPQAADSIVPKAETEPTAQQLVAHCRALVSAYKVPDRIELRETLPTTVTGKLLRRSLKDEAASLHQAAG